MKFLPAFLLFCAILPFCHAVSIVEFCPDTYLLGEPDEYLVLDGDGSLDGITVSDGEGGFRFPPGSMIHGRMVVAYNGSAYRFVHDEIPDFEIYNYAPEIPDVIPAGTFRLANSRDELLLYDHNRLLQKVEWPADVKPREGQVHFFSDGRWDPRVRMIGQTQWEPGTFENVSGACFVSPDCSLMIYQECIGRAKQEILLNVYEFTSIPMAEELIRARERGVPVTILVEGGPVGGISPEEQSVIGMLTAHNITVYQMGTTPGSHAPYRYDHAKYVVVDSYYTLLASENFGENGFPGEGKSGNRGWGVCILDPAVAGYFRDVMISDIKGKGISRATGWQTDIESPGGEERVPEFMPVRFEGARVTPVLSPDTSDLVAEMIRGADTNVDIEQAYIRNESRSVPNRFLAEAINASRRGVHARVLLDSYWFNTEGTDDNDEMVSWINQVAAAGHLPLEARLVDLGKARIEKIHNKGVIVDGRKVLISSINWNTNSPTFNREAGLIIEQPDAGRYFSDVFEKDWERSGPVTTTPGGTVDWMKTGVAVVVVVLLIALYWWRTRL